MGLTRITIRQFEAFLAIVDLNSIAAAATRLGLTSSAVSQLLAELERELGFRLFDRTTRRVNLSSAGRDFLPSAESVLRHLQAAEQAASDIRNRAAGIVRVGAPLVLASTAIPNAIASYRQLHPKVVVRVVDTSVDQLVDRVANGDVDLAVGPDKATGERVHLEPLFTSPWVLWCAENHPLARRRRILWRDLREVPIVATSRDHETSVDQMLADQPIHCRISPVEVVDNVTTAFGLAAQGLGVTLTPDYVKPLAVTFGLTMRRVTDPETIREVCIYRPLNRELSPPADGFAKFLAAFLETWNRTMQAQ
ncbi:LysR family transcriptional regulator [Burkholderia stagnalis]|uniref:LysR family transcriptional regulator n=1 Tax=Burkholderia stagnalis TaxID=1503054 RepID=UPI000F6007CD|nr:LysR substrate-binding domain-containing protein [Burkholderia stagnalis]RQX85396.1 LysR family transcriptional regulator [Burkholderia stagnalis]RQY27911.1 LysR family transcriptional regulator [Burkholderia stagnalis]